MTLGRRALLAAPLLAAAPAARAQGEVNRILCSFPPGAALDAISRMVADAAARGPLGTTVVETRAGANGNIAAAQAARARPDGRTLVSMIDVTLSLNPHLYGANLGFAPEDLQPVATIGLFPVVLLVHPSSGIADFAGFLAAARSRSLLYASAGSGSPGHLAMEALRHAFGLPRQGLEHVSFRGNAQAVTELVAGRVEAGFIAIGGGPQFIQEGRLRALAVSGPARAPLLPAVPTVAELGHPGFDLRFAFVLYGPRGMPPERRAQWAQAAAEAMAANRPRIEALGVDAEAAGPAETAAFVARAHARWGAVARETGMQVE
ncbi:MAG: tripartite tricarboxylate transporter substrate binding protein [Acetobacteraceae bacterium]|nr:tripartite tricarboxylate transporter substrate binding protein [Acetobacteraceae bacterium]